MDTLGEIAQLVRVCTDCELHRERTNSVPGEGDPDASLMFIGEGPGFQEDRQGRPFVGPAGLFLEELLAGIGLTRREVFIANMVKCRPPQNRDPSPSEMSACGKYLDRQIELVDPTMIVTLGRFSLARFFPGETIGRAHGRLRWHNQRAIFPIMHPAAALHRVALRDTIIEDFQAIPGLLEQLRQSPVPPELEVVEDTPPSEQLPLF